MVAAAESMATPGLVPPLFKVSQPTRTKAKSMISQLQTEIRTRYVPSFYLEMTVNVKPEDRFFFVLGEVRQSDRYLYSGHTTVLKAIAAAKGFTDFADKTEVQVTRASNGQKEKIDCKKAQKNSKLDLVIYPGDSIFVPRRIF